MDQAVRLKHVSHFFLDSDNLSHIHWKISVKCKLVCILSGILIDLKFSLGTSLVAYRVKHLPAMRETRVQSLGQEGPLEKETVTTPVLLPRKSHGRRSMVGYCPWDHKESDTIEQQHDTFSLRRFSGPLICKTGTWRVRQGKSSIFITTFFPRTVWYSNYESQTMCYWIRENWFCFLPSLINFLHVILNFNSYHCATGFSRGSADKASACNAGDLASIPGLGRYPEKGKGYLLQYSGLENSMDCIVHGVAESDTTEQLSLLLCHNFL